MARAGFIIILSVLFSTNLIAQIADPSIHHELKDSIIARYNRNDLKSIYQLANAASFQVPKKDVTTMLTNIKRGYG